MGIKELLSNRLGITTLTASSLKEAVVHHNNNLSDAEKRRINREIALCAIETEQTADKDPEDKRSLPSLSGVNVLGINHASPLDVTINWKNNPDGTLELAGYRIDAGGDQVNVSKVFSNFNRKISLISLTGKEDGKITDKWEHSFLDNNILPSFIRDEDEDQQVEVINMIGCDPVTPMHGWRDKLSKRTVDEMNTAAITTLENMFMEGQKKAWMVLSAGGPVRYDPELAYYSTLIEQVKKKYHNKVELIIDFKFMSGPEEAMSVINIPREKPQDIIKPNLEEFVQILISSGLAGTDIMDISTACDDIIKKYALKLRERYNLLGILVSMDKKGSMLAMKDMVIREKGIRITPACHTAAGDSLKAGFVYALSRGRSFEDAMHTGNLFGASTASMEGTLTVTPAIFSEMENMARAQKIAPEVEYI